MLSGRLAKWAMLLAPFDIKFTPQKAIKGQAVADFLAAHPFIDNEEVPNDLLDDEVMFAEIKTWKLYFDGAARSWRAGVGIVFITPAGRLIPYSFSLLDRSIQIMWLNIRRSSLASNWPWKCVLTSLKYSMVLS